MNGPIPHPNDHLAWRWIVRHVFHRALDWYRDGRMGVVNCDRCHKGYVFDL